MLAVFGRERGRPAGRAGENRRKMEKMQKILLDTDIGGDIDDAICLACLPRGPRCGNRRICG